MLPRWLIGFRALGLASAFAAAFVPIATYITDDKRDWLWVHIGVNIAAYIAVALTTIYTTISLTQQDHNKYRVPAYWANNVVMRTWYLGVSRTWRWHVAAAIGRLGLALALAQYIHITYFTLNGDFAGILRPFLYYSYNTLGANPILENMYRSQWETALIGLVVLCGFALGETGLLTAISLLSKYLHHKAILIAISIRIGIVVFVVMTLFVSQTFIRNEYVHAMGINYHDLLRDKPQAILREWHKGAFTWMDDGTMLTAWLMRPMLHSGYNYACTDTEPQNYLYECNAYNNRLWVFTDVLTALVSYATYILTIGSSFQLAHYLHWRREQGMTHHAPTNDPTTP